MQIFNLSTLEQFPNIFQVNMRAPPEAVRTQIQQLLVDRMVKNNIFVLWLFVQLLLWLFALLVLVLWLSNWSYCQLALLSKNIVGKEDVSGRTGHCDEFCGSRSGERRAEDALGSVSH